MKWNETIKDYINWAHVDISGISKLKCTTEHMQSEYYTVSYSKLKEEIAFIIKEVKDTARTVCEYNSEYQLDFTDYPSLCSNHLYCDAELINFMNFMIVFKLK